MINLHESYVAKDSNLPQDLQSDTLTTDSYRIAHIMLRLDEELIHFQEQRVDGGRGQFC